MQVADQSQFQRQHAGVGQATEQGGRAENQDFVATYVGTQRGPLTISLIAALSDGMGGAR